MRFRLGTPTDLYRRTGVGILILCAAVFGSARSAAAQQLRIRHDAFGRLEISNPVTGRSALVPSSAAVAKRDGRPSSAPLSVYDDLIVENARLNHIRPDLIRAVVNVESGFNPSAQSPKGALGLMQLMPATARLLNVSNPFDPEQNIRGGSAYLRQLLDRYDNNEALALAAYNAGPGAVDRYGHTIPPYRETERYVSRVSGMAGVAGEADAVKSTGTRFYKIVEVIDGQQVTTYTNRRPAELTVQRFR